MTTKSPSATIVRRNRVRLGSLLILCAAAFVMIASTGGALRGQPPGQPAFDPLHAFPPSLQEKLRKPGDLTLRDSDLRDALLTISESWNVDIAFTKDVTGDVNGVFNQRPLKEILDSILTINGYGYRPNGVGLVVQSMEELGKSNPAFRSVTLALPVNTADDKGVDQIVQGAQMFLSKHGKIQPIAATKSMVVVDYPDRVDRVQRFIRELSETAAGSTGSGAVRQARRFLIQYVTAEEIQGVLEGVVGEAGNVSSMTKENVVVVYGPPTLLDLAAKMIKENDVPRPQVRITAYIYDLSLDETERFGFNWHHMSQGRSIYEDGMGSDLFGFNSGLLQTVEETATDAADVADAAATTSPGIQAGSMVIRSLGGNFSLESTIQALDETRGARLLASPQATVQHLEEAVMKAVREVPYQQLTESTDGGAVGTTEFREAGITLTVTPYVAQDNTITLNVQPTFSVLAGFQQGQPIIDTREAKTRVRVDNGQIIVIGGLRQRSEVETVSGIPYLMNWKHFGKFFRAHSTTIVESELVVFIKPEIVYPNTLGDPHDEAAASVTVSTLEQLPFAHQGPFIPYCGDENCPYHHPRPRGPHYVPFVEPTCPHRVGKMGGPEKATYGNMSGSSYRPPQGNHYHQGAPYHAPNNTPYATPANTPSNAAPSNPPRQQPQAAPAPQSPAGGLGPQNDSATISSRRLPRGQQGMRQQVRGQAAIGQRPSDARPTLNARLAEPNGGQREAVQATHVQPLRTPPRQGLFQAPMRRPTLRRLPPVHAPAPIASQNATSRFPSRPNAQAGQRSHRMPPIQHARSRYRTEPVTAPANDHGFAQASRSLSQPRLEPARQGARETAPAAVAPPVSAALPATSPQNAPSSTSSTRRASSGATTASQPFGRFFR